MADTSDVEPTPAGVPQRASKNDRAIVVEGVLEIVRCALSEVLAPAVIERALDKARKQPAVKALLAGAKGRGGGAAAKAARGPANIRSGYNVFLQECFHHLKAANIQVGLMDVGGLWNVLPEDVKADFNKRFSAIKEAYNAKLAAGTHVVLTEETAAYEASQGLEPVDYVALYNKHKDAIAAATEAKAAGTPATSGKAKPKALAAAAAPANNTPAAETKRPAEDTTEEKQKHKKQKKEKKQTDAATPAADAPTEKKRKHKKDKKHKKEMAAEMSD